MTAPYVPLGQQPDDELTDLEREFEEQQRRASATKHTPTGRPRQAPRSAAPDTLTDLEREFEASQRPNAFGQLAQGPQFQQDPPTLKRPAAPPAVVADATRSRDPRQQPYKPGVIERALPAVAQSAEHMVRNPLETVASFVTEPVASAERMLSPTVEGAPEVDATMRRINEQRYGAVPSGYKVEGVTGKERALGAVQTAANVALGAGAKPAVAALTPRMGALGAQSAVAAGSGVVAGAVYTPDDPLVGAIVGGLLAAPIPAAAHGTIAGVGKARPKVARAFAMLQAIQKQPNPSARAELVARMVAQFDEADMRFAANDPHYGPIFREALQARGQRVTPDISALKGLLDEMGPDTETPTIELAGPRSQSQGAEMQGSGFAAKPATGVELPQGVAGRMGTVDAVKRAKELVGPDVFEQQVRESLGSRTDEPLSQAAAVEETARRIVANADANAPDRTAVPEAGADQVATARQTPPPSKFLPPRESLARFGGTMYHETSIDRAVRLLDASVQETPRPLYLSNAREMAIGQGTNKGVHIEFDARYLRGNPHTGKPGLDFTASQGAGEFVADNGQTDYQNAVRSITIMPDAQVHGRQWATRLRRFLLPTLESQGWVKQTLPDGSIRLTHPERSAASIGAATVRPIEDAPTAKRKRTGETVVDEDGVQRFATARTDAGRRRPVDRVSTDGLLDEHLELQAKFDDAQRRSQYHRVFDDDTSEMVTVGTRKGGGPTEQSKALRNIEDLQRAMDEVEQALEARGIPRTELMSRIEGRQEMVIERRAIAGDYDSTNLRRNQITDDNGNVLFDPSPVVREFGEAIRFAPRRQSGKALGPDDVMMDPTAGAGERLVSQAIKIGDDLFDGGTSWDALSRAARQGYDARTLLDRGGMEVGYLTDTGRFVTGPEASQIALKANQFRRNTKIAKQAAEGAIPLAAWRWAPLANEVKGLRGPKGNSDAPLPGSRKDRVVAGRIGENYSPVETFGGDVPFNPEAGDLPTGWRRALVYRDRANPSEWAWGELERFNDTDSPYTVQGETLRGAVEGYMVWEGRTEKFISRTEAQQRYANAMDFGPEGRDWTTGEALFDPAEGTPRKGTVKRPTGEQDLFGNDVTADVPEQTSLLDEQAGTARSRNLRETEQAARVELDRLQQVVEMSDDPAEVRQASARVAELQRLVNRDKAITPDELANRARAESQEAPARDLVDEFDGEQKRQSDVVQGVLFSPAPLSAKAAAFSARVRRLVTRSTPASVMDDVTNLRAISIGMSKAIGVPLHQGRGNLKRMSANGAFWIKPEVIRVRRLAAVGTVAHENGHFLSKKFGIRAIVKAEPDKAIRTAAMKELVQMGKNLYGARKPRGGYGEEGVAEAMKFYVIDPAKLAREAPTYSKVLARLLDENPDIKAAFDWARDEFQRFDAAPAESKLEAMIARKPARRFNLSPRDLVRWIWDDLEPVREAVADLGGSDSPTQDAYNLARLAKGNAGRSREMLEKGVLDFTSRKRVSRGLSAILEDLGERNFDAFERYWISEQVLTKTAQGIDTGFDPKAAQAVVDAGRKNPRYVAAAKELWDYRGALLKYVTDAGLMTPDELANIRAKNPTPTPFYRHFDAGEGSKGLKSVGRGLAQRDAGVRSLKGSDRQIVPPLESLVGDTYRLVDAAHKHHAAQTLVKVALETEGGGRVAELLPEVPQEARRIGMSRVQNQLIDAGWTPPDPASGAVPLDQLLAFYERKHLTGRDVQDMVMPVVIDGERKWVQINDRALWDALEGMTVKELGVYERLASIPTRMLRAGATQLNPDFMLVNPLRDSFQGAIYSRGPTRPPGYHIARGLFHMIRSKLGHPDEIAARWAQEGGESAGIVGADRRMIAEAYQKTVADLTTHGVRRVGRAVVHPVRTAYAFFASLENATRLGEFAEVRSQRMKQGMSEMDASTDAALAARDVTIDFLKSGQHTRPVNRYVAFLVAQLNDVEKLAKEFNPANAATPEGAKRLATVTARATAMITVPSVMLYLLQKDDPVYQELPEYWKASSWIIVDNEDGPIPYTTESGQKVRVWAFPRPHLLGYVFGYTPEKVLQWLGENDPEALDALAEQAWTAFVPPIIPTAAIPILENWANKSKFNDAPIVPRSAERLPAGMQAQRRTGEVARTLGDATNYSPAKIENVVRGWTGGTGMLALDAADAALKKGKQAAGLPVLSPRQKPGEDPLESIPMLRRFVVPTPQGWSSESVRRLAEKFDNAETKRQAWKELRRRGEREQAAAYLEQHKDAIRSVMTAEENGGTPGPLRSAMKAINDRQARGREIMEQVPDSAGASEQLDQVERSQTEVARRRLGRKP